MLLQIAIIASGFGIVLIAMLAHESDDSKFARETTSGLERAGLETAFVKAYELAARRFARPPTQPVISLRDFKTQLEIAVWCRDRLSRLDGMPAGKFRRNSLRFSLMRQMKDQQSI